MGEDGLLHWGQGQEESTEDAGEDGAKNDAEDDDDTGDSQAGCLGDHSSTLQESYLSFCIILSVSQSSVIDRLLSYGEWREKHQWSGGCQGARRLLLSLSG